MNLATKQLAATPYADYQQEILKDGYNQLVCKLTQGGEALVAHFGKGEKDSGSSLYNSYRALKCLEYYGIGFVPRAEYFDGDNDVLIETCVPGQIIEMKEMDNAQLAVVAKQLWAVHSITEENIRTFCSSEGFDMPDIQTAEASLDIFGTQRLAIVAELCPDQAVVDWLNQRLEEAKQNLQSSTANRIYGLRWGDIGGNFITDNDKIWFIDWDLSAIAAGHELSYIKLHSYPIAAQFDRLVSAYAEHSAIPEATLRAEIEVEVAATSVCDVIWAAMKWGQHKADPAAAKKYQVLTYKRMDIYRELTNSKEV